MDAAIKKSKEMFKKGKYKASQGILDKIKHDMKPSVLEKLVIENNDMMNKLMWVWLYTVVYIFMKEVIFIKILCGKI